MLRVQYYGLLLLSITLYSNQLFVHQYFTPCHEIYTGKYPFPSFREFFRLRLNYTGRFKNHFLHNNFLALQNCDTHEIATRKSNKVKLATRKSNKVKLPVINDI